ncbi:unnamed protein product [Soboliphyme baturini]|uniref:Uncharacterized protein n=1 Tax=Soboliphyme baturini TaxID=241478 RepID=A0A183J4L8_9BILA|nr:unnamed protein product [Soboliphyme baturini]
MGRFSFMAARESIGRPSNEAPFTSAPYRPTPLQPQCDPQTSPDARRCGPPCPPRSLCSCSGYIALERCVVQRDPPVVDLVQLIHALIEQRLDQRVGAVCGR